MTEAGPIFEYEARYSSHDRCTSHDSFNAAFLDQQSYKELLQIADTFFHLNMTTHDRVLPCQKNSYMVLVRTPSPHLWRGIGKNISLTVDRIVYNRQYGVLVALVKLKHNFTCNKIPHIVLAKRDSVNNVLVARILDSESDSMEVAHLCSPHRVHGKIGVIIGSGEEILKPDTKTVNGLEVRTTYNVVDRPEVVYTVEQPKPQTDSTSSKFVSFEQFKKMAQEAGDKKDKDVMEITLKSKEYATGQTYQGAPVMQGPRGGKYIIKDGKKKYVPGNATASGSSDVVYNINILE